MDETKFTKSRLKLEIEKSALNWKEYKLENSKLETNLKKEQWTLCLTLSWRRPLSYRNQSIDNGLRHKRVNRCIGLENKDKKIVMILVFFKAV